MVSASPVNSKRNYIAAVVNVEVIAVMATTVKHLMVN